MENIGLTLLPYNFALPLEGFGTIIMLCLSHEVAKRLDCCFVAFFPLPIDSSDLVKRFQLKNLQHLCDLVLKVFNYCNVAKREKMTIAPNHRVSK